MGETKIKIGTARKQPVKGKPDTFDCFIPLEIVDEKGRVVTKGNIKIQQNFAHDGAEKELTAKILDEATNFQVSRSADEIVKGAITALKEDYEAIFV